MYYSLVFHLAFVIHSFINATVRNSCFYVLQVKQRPIIYIKINKKQHDIENISFIITFFRFILLCFFIRKLCGYYYITVYLLGDKDCFKR